MSTLHVSLASPRDWPSAFLLLFQRYPRHEQLARTRLALDEAQQGSFVPTGLFVVKERNEVQGVVACVPQAGASALFWPAQSLPHLPASSAIEAALTEHALTWLTSQGVKLVQAGFTPEEASLGEALVPFGFKQTSALCYLRHMLGQAGESSAHKPCPVLVPWQSVPSDQLEACLLRTYEQTLDFPELNGRRTCAEILAGHSASTGGDTSRWWLVRSAGHDLGVLLVNEVPDQCAHELVYLGLVPSARREGWGRTLVTQVLHRARAESCAQVLVSVDARNTPAWRLYETLGFSAYDRRVVYLWFPGRPEPDRPVQ